VSAVIEWGGEAIELRPERAALLCTHRTLLVADVHLGKARAFRQQGVPVPGGTTQETLARLDALVRATAAERVVFLGDLLHSRHAQGSAALAEFARWRAAHAQLALTLVRGNHDAHAGDPPATLGIQAVDEPFPLGTLALCHHPHAHPRRPQEPMPAAAGAPLRMPDPALRSFMDDAIERAADVAPAPVRRPAAARRPLAAPDAGRPRIAGHEHPCIGLHGRTDSLRLPCFHFGAAVAVLPAFGAFTGMHAVRRVPGDRVWAVLADRVVEVPTR
jgi:DNA ligase-associated metallophosphoesterase